MHATDGVPVEPDRAYVVPHGMIGRVEDGVLRILPSHAVNAPHRPVDHLFRSLAPTARRAPVIAVLLGDGALDGAQGVREVRHAGGVTVSSALVHDPIDGASLTDLVTAPADVPARLAYLAAGPDDDGAGRAGELVAAVVALLGAATGTDFTDCRPELVRRRVRRRMWAHGLDRLDAYLDRLASDPDELRALERDLRTRPDRFFDAPALLDAIVELALHRGRQGGPFRAWVPACGSGVEAWTLAMRLAEAADRSGGEVPFEIVATDTYESALVRARAGLYPASIELDVDPDRLARHFVPDPAGYAVGASINRRCTFLRHDVLRDPPLPRVDLVYARHVMAAADPAIGDELVRRLRSALDPGGHLVLASSDPPPPDAFVPAHPRAPIYRHVGSGRSRRRTQDPLARLEEQADQILLRAYAPPAVVIDDEGVVRLTVGDVSDVAGATAPGDALALPPPLAAELDRLLAQARADGERVAGEPLAVETPEGARWVRLEVLPYPDDVGRRDSSRVWLVVLEDVTGRQREDERARQLAGERANEVKDEFLAMLAHELRNPLAPLHRAIRLLRRDPAEGGPPPEWTLALAERQVQHLAHLIDDLLDASRLTQNKIVPRLELVDLSVAVRRVADDHRRTAEEAGQVLQLSAPNEPIWVLADATRIDQVFANLLENAIKFSHPGGHLDVRLEAVDREAVVTVTDEGVGVDPELLPRIFDLFVQGRRGLDRSMGGLGIGLTIVRRLVELHGGRVEVRSAGPGAGSEFVVRLPTQPAPAVEAGSADAGLGEATIARDVLVVDDNRDAADTLSTLLEAAGHRVRTRYDGPTTIAAVEEDTPDVVLLDIGLPGMDGYAVARELRHRLGDRAPVLAALTGYGDEKDRQRSADAGFRRHFVKPIEVAVLDALLADPLLAAGGGDRAPAQEPVTASS